MHAINGPLYFNFVTYTAHSIFITTAIASLHVRIIMHVAVTVSTCVKLIIILLINFMFTAIKSPFYIVTDII